MTAFMESHKDFIRVLLLLLVLVGFGYIFLFAFQAGFSTLTTSAVAASGLPDKVNINSLFIISIMMVIIIAAITILNRREPPQEIKPQF